MPRSAISLQALEVFEALARTGSLQATAAELRLSISSVSHHLSRLEAELVVTLVDRTRRPMRLTPAGDRFLGRVEGGLGQIRQAQREALSGGVAMTRALSPTVVEDLESDVAPELAVTLARTLPHARLMLRAEPSHRAIEMIQGRELDMAVASDPLYGADGLVDRVLLRDPFVLAAPMVAPHEPGAYVAGRMPLPLLRYNARHIIGALVEAHLRRHGVALEHRYEIDSNQLIMALVASGHGWAITTPSASGARCGFRSRWRSTRCRSGASRAPSRSSHPEQDQEVAAALAAILRRLIGRMCVEPMLGRFPLARGRARAARRLRSAGSGPRMRRISSGSAFALPGASPLAGAGGGGLPWGKDDGLCPRGRGTGPMPSSVGR